jgi:hypothetical protein
MIKTSGRRLLLLGTLLATGLALGSYLRFSTKSLPLLEMRLALPRPPISLQPSRFPCLDSLAERRSRKRVVVLHGADWTLDSTVEMKCFPEREVVLSVEVGRGFLPHPITERIRFWIAKKGDVIYAKIVDSKGSQKLDMDALDLVTNHKCGLQIRKNCHVQSAHFVPRID